MDKTVKCVSLCVYFYMYLYLSLSFHVSMLRIENSGISDGLFRKAISEDENQWRGIADFGSQMACLERLKVKRKHQNLEAYISLSPCISFSSSLNIFPCFVIQA